jgi:hypothetical protein
MTTTGTVMVIYEASRERRKKARLRYNLVAVLERL